MGGCRCSYRNCTMRSDGQTHMFHYPVFERVRCHQWIMNSHRPDFLNLKVSQLKNRVICQHHFTDESFMNCMKARLKANAVPTEDGPYCAPAQAQPMVTEDDDKPVIPINPDDIENEILDSVEKRQHSSLKYGEFLISDVTDLFNSSHNNIKSQASLKPKRDKVPNENNYTIIYSNDEPIKSANEPEVLNTCAPGLNPGTYVIQYDEAETANKLLNIHTPVEIKESQRFNISRKESIRRNPDKVVKILSEKTISEPVVVAGQLEPVSPSMIISRHTRKHKSVISKQSECEMKPPVKSEDISVQTNNNKPETIPEQVIPIEYDPKELKENQNAMLEQVNTINLNNIEIQNKFNDEVQKQKESVPNEQALLNCMIETAEKLKEPEYTEQKISKPVTPTRTPVINKSLLKNKITPEKLATIEAKRQFNLKLRDVISTCLDNLDNKPEADKKTPEKVPIVKRSICSKEPSPNSGHIVEYLEARLQKMESTLLSKIDHNTQKINELKRSVKPSKNIKNANTQTYLNHMTELSQKQYLYKEISKFLSPNAIIKVYEELFLTPEEEIDSSTPRKLRRRR